MNHDDQAVARVKEINDDKIFSVDIEAVYNIVFYLDDFLSVLYWFKRFLII